MKCAKCGTKNEAGATECAKCGVQFADLRRGAEDPKRSHIANPNESWCRFPGCHEPATIFPGVLQGGGAGVCRRHLRHQTAVEESDRENARALLADLRILCSGERTIRYRHPDEWKERGADAPLREIVVKT